MLFKKRLNYYFSNLKNFIELLIYLFPLAIIWGNFAINSIIILIDFSFLIYVLKNQKILELNKPKYIIAIVVWFIFFITDYLVEFSTNNQTSSYLRFFIFFIAVAEVVKNKFFIIKNLSIISFFLLVVISFDLIFQSIFGYNILGIESVTNIRNASFFIDEYIAGTFIVRFYIFSFIFLLIFLKNFWFEYFYFALITLSLFGIFASGDRMPLFLFILIATFTTILTLKIKIVSYKAFISYFFLALISLGIFSQNLTKDQKARYVEDIIVKTHLHEFFSNESIQNIYEEYVYKELYVHNAKSIPTSQIDLMKISLKIFEKNKVFGIGQKNFFAKCIEIYDHCENHPHNYYVQLLTEKGLINSILVILLVIFSTIKFIINHKNIYHFLIFSCLLNFIFPIMYSGNLFTTGNSSFLFFILALLTIQFRNNKFSKIIIK
jgi:O-antigen ligase